MDNKLLSDYSSLIFDCDGVILNSNNIKTNAFYESTKQYGRKQAQALVDYHILNGGISRYSKFEYFLEQIMHKEIQEKELSALLNKFSEKVVQGLMNCEITDHLEDIKRKTSTAKWLVVSGGDQVELRRVFKKRGIYELFDGGIFGSPDNKLEILSREINNNNIRNPALFIGDSRYDHIVANKYNIDFVFVSNWTEFEEYESYCAQYDIPIIKSISDLK